MGVLRYCSAKGDSVINLVSQRQVKGVFLGGGEGG